MKAPYTAIIRKSRLQYVGVCLELNVSACGDTVQEVENNLKNAVELYLKDIDEHPDTAVLPVTTEELIEFLNDTVRRADKAIACPPCVNKADTLRLVRPTGLQGLCVIYKDCV